MKQNNNKTTETATMSPLSNRCSLSVNLRNIRIGFGIFVPLLLCCLATSASAGVWTEYAPGKHLYGQIIVGSTQVWAMDQEGGAYQYNSSTNKFEWRAGNLARIAVGTGNTVWAEDASGDLYQYNFSTNAFQKVSLSLGSIGVIAAGGQGVWGLSTKGVTYEWDSVTKSFVTPPHGGVKGAEGLFVGSYEIGVWEFDASGHAWLYNTNTDYFDDTPGVLTQLAVGNDQVWGINSSGEVYQYDVATEKWIKPDPSAYLVEIGPEAIAISGASTDWAIPTCSTKPHRSS